MARQTQQRRTRSPFAGVIAIIGLIVVIYVLLNVVKIGWAILAFLAPILLVISLFLNKNVALDYVKMLVNTLKTDLPRGLLYSVGTFVLFPLVMTYIFFKAYMTSKVRKTVNEKRSAAKEEASYTKYEEVEDEDDFLNLPDLDAEPPKEKLKDTGYENLFE